MNEERLIPTTQQLEDVPELLHLIQSLLPVNEAAKTSLLSKSWLLAWHTNPTLRFPVICFDEIKYMKLINNDLLRRYRNNIPIQSFRLPIYIKNHVSASVLKQWIRTLTSETSPLKELSLVIFIMINPCPLPDEIFAGQNLDTVRVVIPGFMNHLCISSNMVINCVSLRVLELINVHISEEVLDNLLSTCTLLEKINIFPPTTLKTIKVKNLHCLRELKISSRESNNVLEIVDVPNLRLFLYYSKFMTQYIPLPLMNMDSLGNVTELFLSCVIINDALFDMIKSNIPFLETLTIELGHRLSQDSLDIRCVSLKRLTLILKTWQIQVQVFAPKLHFFCYDGIEFPKLSFPKVAPEKIMLKLSLMGPLNYSFFVGMREALNRSSKFDIEILDRSTSLLVPLYLDVDDLRKKITSPAMNVRQLIFSKERPDESLWEDWQYVDVFFSICHPTYVKACHKSGSKNRRYFYELMETKFKDGYWTDLKDVEIKNPCTRKWESLANYSKSSPDESALKNWDFVEFKLNWYSP